jgi:hypothetical protein
MDHNEKAKRSFHVSNSHSDRDHRDFKATSSSATGDVNLTAFSARAINALAGKKIASAGTNIGTATVAPNLG